MNKYVVTYCLPVTGAQPAGTFKNSEIEIDQRQADEIRAELAECSRENKPLVYGRDWDYTPIGPERTIVIEADSYSVAANRTVHFYRVSSVRVTPPECVASVNGVVTVTIQGDPGIKGTGGRGTVPWEDRDQVFVQGRGISKLTADEIQRREDTGHPDPRRRIVIRYWSAVEQKVVKYVALSDQDPGRPELCIDLRPWTVPHWTGDED